MSKALALFLFITLIVLVLWGGMWLLEYAADKEEEKKRKEKLTLQNAGVSAMM